MLKDNNTSKSSRSQVYVSRLKLLFTPLRDVIAPPYTSKIVKFYVERYAPRTVGLLYRERRGFKGFSISPLYCEGRPIYKSRLDGPPLVLRGGEQCAANVSFIVSGSLLSSVMPLDTVRIRSPYGEFLVEPLEVDVRSLEGLRLDVGSSFVLRFETPLILSTKIMMPPVFSGRRRVRGMYKLLPSAGFIFAYLTKLWNSNAPPELALPKPGSDGLWAPYKVGRVADIVLAEVNYRLKPVTVLYDKRNGRFREIRGTVGWIHYRVLHRKPMDVLSRLLALAKYLGIGKSRGIGMGQVSVRRVG